MKAKLFEAVLNNIVTNFEEDQINQEKLGQHKLKRVFNVLYEETVGNKITDPVLRELSEMVLELRRINILQKVFMTFKRLRELSQRTVNKKYMKQVKPKATSYITKPSMSGRWRS